MAEDVAATQPADAREILHHSRDKTAAGVRGKSVTRSIKEVYGPHTLAACLPSLDAPEAAMMKRIANGWNVTVSRGTGSA
jgi:hypothetical protein